MIKNERNTLDYSICEAIGEHMEGVTDDWRVGVAAEQGEEKLLVVSFASLAGARQRRGFGTAALFLHWDGDELTELYQKTLEG